MAIADSVGPVSDTSAAHSRQLTRAVIASTIGTAIEWYDFFLYGTVAGLIFAKLYFPGNDPLTGTLLSFSTFAVGFVARPIGAAIFGHYGDRVGRRSTLVVSLILMGLATFAIAFVPSYAVIGVWGGIILTALRFLQGIGVGGQWGGAVLLTMEWAKTNKHRGFITSWPQFGVPVGLLLANLAFLSASNLTGDNFVTYGWRIPFLLSFILVLIGLYIRLGVEATPTFRRLQAENKIERAPMLEVLKRHPREIVLSTFVRMAEQSGFYLFTTFILAYGTQHLQADRTFLLKAVLVASILSLIWMPLSGWMSDRIGRRRMYLIGVAAMGIFAFIYFALLDSGSPNLIFLAIALSLLPHNMMYGPQAALIAENFTGRLRYSGASLGYQLSSIIAGGPAPLIATALFARYHTGYAVAAYLLVCAVVSFIAALMMHDRTNADIAVEYDEA